jgi:hypothetical protein
MAEQKTVKTVTYRCSVFQPVYEVDAANKWSVSRWVRCASCTKVTSTTGGVPPKACPHCQRNELVIEVPPF